MEPLFFAPSRTPMDTIRTRNSLVLSALTAIFLVAAPVLACSCGKPKTAKAGLIKSDSVFAGKIVAIKHVNFFRRVKVDFGNGKSKLVTASEEFHQLKFVVSRSWKGAPSRTIFVLTDFGTSCSRQYYKGQTYLVYAFKRLCCMNRENFDFHA